MPTEENSRPYIRSRDTKVREQIAELQIASLLLNQGILVSKPYFDQHGTDLLAMLPDEDNQQVFRVARIQCKFRQAGSGFEIASEYVTPGFLCIVLLVPREAPGVDLAHGKILTFDHHEVASWSRNKEDKFTKSFPADCVAAASPRLSDSDIEKIKSCIRTAPVPASWAGRLDFSRSENVTLGRVLGIL